MYQIPRAHAEYLLYREFGDDKATTDGFFEIYGLFHHHYDIADVRAYISAARQCQQLAA